MVFPLHGLARKRPLVHLVVLSFKISLRDSSASASYRWDIFSYMQGFYKLSFRGLEGLYCRCRASWSTCLILRGKNVVAWICGPCFIWVYPVRISTSAVHRDALRPLHMSALNTRRYLCPSGYFMPKESAVWRVEKRWLGHCCCTAESLKWLTG